MAQSLRSFLDKLGPRLMHVEQEIDPVTQAGILCSESAGPVMFENLKGFPGWRMVDILVKDRRGQAAALGLTDIRQVCPTLAARMARGPGRSVLVSDAPCQEVVLTGKDVDIHRLPVPQHSHGDGGRYLGSGVLITKDPDTGVRNESFIRTMLRPGDPNRVGFWMAARHNWEHFLKYAQRGEPMPMAYAIGLHPVYEIMANFSGRHEGYDEFEMAAGILEEDLQLVRCKTVDMEVPAHAEVILEGLVYPDVREQEGPFGEFTTYRSGAEGPAPVFEIKAITHRRNPIFRHIQATRFTDHQPLVTLPMEATYYNRLRDTYGHTEIHDVFCPPWAADFVMIVQMTARWDGQAQSVALSALSGPNLHPKIAITVDDDVDLYNPEEIFWALSTRMNPATDLVVLNNERIHPLDISAPVVKEEVTVMRKGGKVAIDATKPPLWRTADRARFTRVDPMGTHDQSLSELIAQLRQPR